MTRPKPTDDWPHTTRLLPWSLAGFLVIVYLVPINNIQLPISLPLDAKIDRAALIVMGVLWLLALLGADRADRPRLRMGAIHWALLGLLAVTVTSFLLNAHTLVRLDELTLGVKKLAVLASYLVFFVIAASTMRMSEVRAFMAFAVGLACITAIGTIWEYRMGFNAFYEWAPSLIPGSTVELPLDYGLIDSIGRETVLGPTVHPLGLAALLATTLPIAVVGVLISAERRTRLLYGIAAAIILAGAFSTVRKTSLIASATGLLVLLAYRPRMMVRFAPLGVALFLAIPIVAPGAAGSVRDQLSPNQLFGVLSTRDRQADYTAIKPDVIAHPIFGRGFETYDPKKYRVLDNQYLGILVGIGIGGLAAYLILMLVTFGSAHRTIRSGDALRAPPALAVAAAAAVFLVSNFLFDAISIPQYTYLFLFMCAIGAVCAMRPEGQETPTVRAERLVDFAAGPVRVGAPAAGGVAAGGVMAGRGR